MIDAAHQTAVMPDFRSGLLARLAPSGCTSISAAHHECIRTPRSEPIPLVSYGNDEHGAAKARVVKVEF
jgi:hypothetical protein